MNSYKDICANRVRKKWLQANGISPDSFATAPLILLQAQRIATTLLKEHGKLLGQNEAAALNNFLCAMSNGKARSKITDKQAYRVMNIGTAVNRKLYKQYRQLNKQG